MSLINIHVHGVAKVKVITVTSFPALRRFRFYDDAGNMLFEVVAFPEDDTLPAMEEVPE